MDGGRSFHQAHGMQGGQRTADVHRLHAHEFGEVMTGGFAFIVQGHQDTQLVRAEPGQIGDAVAHRTADQRGESQHGHEQIYLVMPRPVPLSFRHGY